MEKMLRIYFLQQWFNLSDPQAEDAIYDSESMPRFVRVELGDEGVPDDSRPGDEADPQGDSLERASAGKSKFMGPKSAAL
jgi:IS5 family transposase